MSCRRKRSRADSSTPRLSESPDSKGVRRPSSWTAYLKKIGLAKLQICASHRQESPRRLFFENHCAVFFQERVKGMTFTSFKWPQSCGEHNTCVMNPLLSMDNWSSWLCSPMISLNWYGTLVIWFRWATISTEILVQVIKITNGDRLTDGIFVTAGINNLGDVDASIPRTTIWHIGSRFDEVRILQKHRLHPS